MSLYNLYVAPPASLTANNDVAITLGTEFAVNTTCWVTQLRWFRPNAAGTGIRKGALYTVNANGLAGTLIYGPVDFPMGADGSWVVHDMVLRLEPGRYRVAVWHPNPGLYAATSNFFSTGAGGTSVTRGPITVPNAASALGQKQGSYANSAAMTFPASVYLAGAYFSDVTVSDTDPNPPVGALIKVRESESAWTERRAKPKVYAGSGLWTPGKLKHRTSSGWVER